MGSSEVVTLHGFAHGGEAVGRLEDGRVVFVAHAIPGETVRLHLTEEHPRWCRGVLEEVLEASPDRVEPPCPYFGPDRCGGCRLQHIAADRRRELLRQVVVDQLERIGKIIDPPVSDVIEAGDYEYRNRARFAVDAEGSLAFRRHASHDLIPIDRCLLLDEATHAVRVTAGDAWAGQDEVEVRAAAEGHAVVTIAGGSSARAMGDRELTERAGGLEFRVSARSFFQSNRAGASILLDLVRGAAAMKQGETALDLYAGVGLFAMGLAADGATVTAVESHPASAADARHNLASQAEVIQAPVEKVLPRLRRDGRQFDVVVLDPPRRGAGRDVTGQVSALARRAIVIVACDPAALGRDAGLLTRSGWQLTSAVPVDQFAQTGHVEVVATFVRAG